MEVKNGSSPTPKKRINLSRSAMKLDKYDFALILSRSLSTSQLDTIILIFNRHKFKHLLVNDAKLSQNYVLLLRFDNPEAVLKEAEKQGIFKKMYHEKPANPNSAQESLLKKFLSESGDKMLDPRVKELETMARFTFANRRCFLKELPSTPNSLITTPIKNDLFLSNLSNFNPDPRKQLSVTFDLQLKPPVIPGPLSYTSPIKNQGSRENSLTAAERGRKTITSNLKKISRINASASPAPSKTPEQHSPEQSSDQQQEEQDNFREYLKIFTPAEYCQLIWLILSSVEVNITDPSLRETFALKDKASDFFAKKKFIDFLTGLKVLKSVNPIHTEEKNKLALNSDQYVDYFGSKVGIYFKFMLRYMKWLIIPAVFGIVIQYLIPEQNIYFKFYLEAFYCLMIMIWASLFVRFWERESNELSVKWGSYGYQFKISNTRPQFKGDMRLNPITGLPERHRATRKKVLAYLVSLLIHVPMIVLSLAITSLFLNIKGNVLQTHWIYIDYLSQLSKPGALFDKKSKMNIIVSMLQVTFKIIFTNINAKISKKTTDWENHRTHTSYNNSLTIKRFVFAITYTFITLVYIAFWKLDINALRLELIGLFASDEIRRLVNESIIPFVVKTITAKRPSKNHKNASLQDSGKKYQPLSSKFHQQSLQEYVVEKVNESNQADYNVFEDYYEIVIQFGYITLFAAAFPLSAALSLFFNVIELLSDTFKLKNALRRPLPETVNGIGAWMTALKAISFLSIITNSILIAYSAEFRVTIADQVIQQDTGNHEGQMLAIVFVVEHIMLAVTYCLRNWINSEPSWVRTYVSRNIEKKSGLWQ